MDTKRKSQGQMATALFSRLPEGIRPRRDFLIAHSVEAP